LSLILVVSLLRQIKLHLSFLGILFLSFLLQLGEEWFWVNDLIPSNLYLLELTEFAIFIPAPAFYLFAKYQIEDKFSKKDLLHFIPVLLVIANFLQLYFADESLKLCYALNKLKLHTPSTCALTHPLLPLQEKVLDFINIVQLSVYIFLTLPILKKLHKEKSKKYESDYISWSNFLSTTAVVTVVLVITDVFFIDSVYDTFSILYLTSISFLVILFLIKHTIFFSTNQRNKNYATLMNNEIQLIYRQVSNYLQTDNNFLKVKTNLGSVAHAVNIPRNKIQYAFENMGLNFKDFLNQLRIEKAKEYLDNSNAYTIEAIGSEVGYSSKATFYKYFKQFEGITPNEYLKKRNRRVLYFFNQTLNYYDTNYMLVNFINVYICQ